MDAAFSARDAGASGADVFVAVRRRYRRATSWRIAAAAAVACPMKIERGPTRPLFYLSGKRDDVNSSTASDRASRCGAIACRTHPSASSALPVRLAARSLLRELRPRPSERFLQKSCSMVELRYCSWPSPPIKNRGTSEHRQEEKALEKLAKPAHSGPQQSFPLGSPGNPSRQ